MRVGAHKPMKMPNLSAWAGSESPTETQVRIEHATDANEAKKHKFDKFLLVFILILSCNNKTMGHPRLELGTSGLKVRCATIAPMTRRL